MAILGMQIGFVFDFAASSWFHIQPGMMYVQKGMEDSNGDVVKSHYFEFPLLLSFKLDALRLNVGPYFGRCLDGAGVFKTTDLDIGLSTGIGFDIGKFYIGIFYEYGTTDTGNDSSSSYNGLFGIYNPAQLSSSLYNRTFGLNVGINL